MRIFSFTPICRGEFEIVPNPESEMGRPERDPPSQFKIIHRPKTHQNFEWDLNTKISPPPLLGDTFPPLRGAPPPPIIRGEI